MRPEFPGILFMAEVYGRENYGRYLDSGFDLLYDKSGAYDILRDIIQNGRSARELTWNWQFLGGMQPSMLNFLENHDEQRLSSLQFAGNPDAAWAAIAFALLFNTASFMLYFGQEVGEDASESENGRTSIFDWSTPAGVSDLSQLVYKGASLPPARNEVLSSYRELLTIARRPVFRNGATWDLCYCNAGTEGLDPDRHFVFARYDDDEAWLVLCNFGSSRASVAISFPDEFRHAAGLVSTGSSIEAPPHGYALMKFNKKQ